jgi:hypothetical protein
MPEVELNNLAARQRAGTHDDGERALRRQRLHQRRGIASALGFNGHKFPSS